MPPIIEQTLDLLSEKTGFTHGQIVIGLIFALFVVCSGHPGVRRFPRRMMGQMGQRRFNQRPDRPRRPPRY